MGVPNNCNEIRINLSLIPPDVQRRIAFATVSAMRRTQRSDPVLWEKIEKRAAEINEGKAKGYNSK